MRKFWLGLTVLLFAALTLAAVYSPALAVNNPAVTIEPSKPATIVFDTLEDLIADIEIAPCPWSKKDYIYRFRSVPSHYHFDTTTTIKAVPFNLETKTLVIGNSSKTDFTVELFYGFKNFILEQNWEKDIRGAIRETQVKIEARIQFLGTSALKLYDDQDKLKETARIIEKAIINKTPLTFVAGDIWISSPDVFESFNEPGSTTVIIKINICEIREQE